MKRVFRGRCYDTEKAELLGEDDSGLEKLFRKRTGEFFLYKKDVSGTAAIEPVTFDQAQEWGEEFFDIMKFVRVFGEIEKTGEKVPLQLVLDRGIINKMKKMAVEEGISISELVTRVFSEKKDN
ncbi:MAG: hypothetical protein IKW90_14715 [Lachnospiraceae bacterium]|nr:hypothetical protein [Lachnospiraceae bacterium]